MATIPDIIIVGANGAPGKTGTPDKVNGLTPLDPDQSKNGTRDVDWPHHCHCSDYVAEDGGPGTPGGTGGQGGHGEMPPAFGFQIGRLMSDFLIQSCGGTGRTGGKGGDGGNGGDGQNSATNPVKCLEKDILGRRKCEPAKGGRGGDGAAGGDGGPGGDAGDGGDIFIFYHEPQGQGDGYNQVMGASLPGHHGSGGPIGAQGQTGQGGTNEQVEGESIPERAAPGDPPRRNPSPGRHGGNGKPGAVIVHNIDS